MVDIINRLRYLSLAYGVLYFLSVLASGAISLVTIFAMRSRRHSAGSLLGWVIALLFCMLFWKAIYIAAIVINFNRVRITTTTSLVLWYFQVVCLFLSFIFLLCIAKHGAWDQPTPTAVPVQVYPQLGAGDQRPSYASYADPQELSACNTTTTTNRQQNYYYQAPEYNGTPNHVNP